MVIEGREPPAGRAYVRAAAGSVCGLEHRRLGRNNQDGAAVRVDHASGVAVAAVTDGCSQGAFSEVGARFAAAWLASALPAIGAEVSADEDVAASLARAVEARLLEALARIAGELAPEPASLRAIVADYFLFTFLAAVMTERRVVILGAGDGIYSVDGEACVLDSGPDNAPAYLGYGLLAERDAIAPSPRVRVLHDGEPHARETVALWTDGALGILGRDPVELARFERERRYLENPSLVQKRLNVLLAEGRTLHDDTTVALLARGEAMS